MADELPAKLSELGLRPRVMAKPGYTLCRLSPDDKDAVIEFLRRYIWISSNYRFFYEIIRQDELAMHLTVNYPSAPNNTMPQRTLISYVKLFR